MDIRTLRYFVEVVRQQSFTRAAEKLFVTQPTISKMLKNLEDELNCTLLLRDGRKLPGAWSSSAGWRFWLSSASLRLSLRISTTLPKGYYVLAFRRWSA